MPSAPTTLINMIDVQKSSYCYHKTEFLVDSTLYNWSKPVKITHDNGNKTFCDSKTNFSSWYDLERCSMPYSDLFPNHQNKQFHANKHLKFWMACQLFYKSDLYNSIKLMTLNRFARINCQPVHYVVCCMVFKWPQHKHRSRAQYFFSFALSWSVRVQKVQYLGRRTISRKNIISYWSDNNEQSNLCGQIHVVSFHFYCLWSAGVCVAFSCA